MLVTMRRNAETKNMVCGNCNHKWNSHLIQVETDDPPYSECRSKCRFCDCTRISEA